MPRIYFVGVCLTSMVDQRTNNMSLINLVEQVQAPSLPTTFPFEVHVYAELDEVDRGRPHHVRIVVTDRQGEHVLVAAPTRIESLAARHRLVSQDLLLDRAGYFLVTAEIAPADVESPRWVRFPGGWPLEVTQGPPPA